MHLSEPKTKVGDHEVAGQVEHREAVGEQEREQVVEAAEHRGARGRVLTKEAGHEAVEPGIVQQHWLAG